MPMWCSLAVALGLLLPAACGDGTSVDLPPFVVGLQQVFGSADGLSSPIDLQAPPGDSRLFIAERPGRIRIAQGGVLLPTPFLDISSRVLPFVGEDGLLSFAFHPQFANGQAFVFVHFIEKNVNPNGDIVVERYQVSSTDPNILQTPGIEVIRIPHPDATNHYGGRVAFGPDGMLYLSTGDGGGGGDQFHNSQNVGTHLAKLLRLDVSTLPYAIPPDNPTFPGAARNENWAMGLRNPFRYAFDVPTGRLYIADVGQDQREEIDVVQANSSGLNYGWNLMEGLRCFPNGGQCDMTALTLPVYDYDHSQGCAIIGGYVYRGAAIPELEGSYLFSDLCSGWLRSLLIANGVVNVRQAPNVNVGTPLSFGQDGFGEIYVLTNDNRVLRIVRQ
jgi:glucose/arabinose dehydrogenase